MSPAEIHEKLKSLFGDAILDFNDEVLDPYIQVKPEHILEIARFLKEDSELEFTSLMCLSGLDYGADDDLGVAYSLHSMKHKHRITIRVNVPRDNPRLSSVESIWRTADWHEREAYDLVGIYFENHPDLRRILCPDDWEGHPLRKDYVVQEFYHGIRVPYQEDWGKFETFERNPERGHFVFKFEPRVPDLAKSGERDGEQESKQKD